MIKDSMIQRVNVGLKYTVLDSTEQFVIFKPLSYCFKETIGFDVRTSFANCPLSRLIR